MLDICLMDVYVINLSYLSLYHQIDCVIGLAINKWLCCCMDRHSFILIYSTSPVFIAIQCSIYYIAQRILSPEMLCWYQIVSCTRMSLYYLVAHYLVIHSVWCSEYAHSILMEVIYWATLTAVIVVSGFCYLSYTLSWQDGLALLGFASIGQHNRI